MLMLIFTALAATVSFGAPVRSWSSASTSNSRGVQLSALARGHTVKDAVALRASREASEAFQAAASMAAERLLGHTGTGILPLVRNAMTHLSVEQARKQLQLPPDVTAMFGKKHTADQPQLSPAAVDRAVLLLNNMATKAQARLDTKAIECKSFKNRNQETLQQVASDLSRFGGIIADLQRGKTKALSGIDSSAKGASLLEEQLETDRFTYNKVRQADLAKLDVLKSDLAVMELILKVTACPGTYKFLQGSRAAASSLSMQICANSSSINVTFVDPRIQASVQQLSPHGRRMLEVGLGRSGAEDAKLAAVLRAGGLAAMGEQTTEDLEDGDEAEPAPEVHMQPHRFVPRPVFLGTAKQAPSGPVEAAAPQGQSRKCVNADPDCGLLHDTFSMLWGDARDRIVEQESKVRVDELNQRKKVADINAQLMSLASQKGGFQNQLAETSASAAAEVAAQNQKTAQQQDLQKLYQHGMDECKSTIDQILFTDLCGLIKVRNSILGEAGRDLPEDCEVSDWVPGQCSVPCDDALIGGNLTLRREILSSNSAEGIGCPVLNQSAVCKQVKCPVDCKLGEWSGFSQCTKECGGGLQGRSRNVVQKSGNGGATCDSQLESRPCNTGSCDRDCRLAAWTAYSPCSQACDRGFQERQRKVALPKRAAGKCPNADSAARYEKQACNILPCVGDEVCIAEMDLVIALDGSGSFTEKGFDVLKGYAADLVKRLKAQSYGKEAMRVGVVQFGNGKLDADGVVSEAIEVSALSEDFGALEGTIRGLTVQKGFTNLAQAAMKVKSVLEGSARQSAERVALLVTDGRPTERRQTLSALNDLRDSARVVLVHIKGFPSKRDRELLQSYPSVPWRSNYVYIPGKKNLKHATQDFVTKTLVQMCAKAESETALETQARVEGFRLIREGVVCEEQARASSKLLDIAACKSFAADSGDDWNAFAYSESGDCLVYGKKCNSFSRNITYDVYDRKRTAAEKMLSS